jgi:hypothetical protein
MFLKLVQKVKSCFKKCPKLESKSKEMWQKSFEVFKKEWNLVIFSLKIREYATNFISSLL